MLIKNNCSDPNHFKSLAPLVEGLVSLSFRLGLLTGIASHTKLKIA